MKKIWTSPMKRKGGQLLIGVLAALAFILVIYYANHDRPVYKEGDTSGTSYEIGKVVGILEDNVTVDESTDGLWRGDMKLQVKILTGAYKGETAEVTNYFSSLYNVRVSQGDKVSIRIDTDDDGGYQVSVYNYYRVPQIIAAIAIFILLLIVIGGKKGAKSAVGIIFTMVCIIWIRCKRPLMPGKMIKRGIQKKYTSAFRMINGMSLQMIFLFRCTIIRQTTEKTV